MTKRNKIKPYDWRRLAAHLRQHPGMWYDLPTDLPLVNPTRVREGKPDAFMPSGAFEVEGWVRGLQRMRFVGDVDISGMSAAYGVAVQRAEMLGEAPPPAPDFDNPPHHVQMLAWWPERSSWGATGPGFTLLPIETPIVERPLGLRPSIIEPEPDPLDDEWTIRVGGKSHWPAIAASCREYPGHWFRILGRWGNYATPIRRGTLAAFRPVGEWEARMRRYELEVRFVGEP